MFTKSLLRSAIVALSLYSQEDSQVFVKATASKKDRKAYPEVEKAFEDWGEDFYWRSRDKTGADGYEITMFQIVGN